MGRRGLSGRERSERPPLGDVVPEPKGEAKRSLEARELHRLSPARPINKKAITETTERYPEGERVFHSGMLNSLRVSNIRRTFSENSPHSVVIPLSVIQCITQSDNWDTMVIRKTDNKSDNA